MSNALITSDHGFFRTVNVDGQNIDFYDVQIEPFSKKIYPDLGEASFVGYNGIVPGPTFWIQRYQQTVVRFKNNQPDTNCSVHLHGSDSKFTCSTLMCRHHR